MNTNKLLGIIKECGDTQEKLAEAIGISRTRLSAKIHSRENASFTQPEILAIKKRYVLSGDEIDGSKRNAVLRKAEGLGYTESETLEVFPALRTAYEEYAACRRENTERESFAAAFSRKQLEKADFLSTKYNISYDTFVDLMRMYNDETDRYYFKGKGKKSHFLSVSKEKYGLTEKQANAAYSAVK